MCDIGGAIENLQIWSQTLENQSSDENLKSEEFDPEWFAIMVDLEESIVMAIQALEEKQQREQTKHDSCEGCKHFDNSWESVPCDNCVQHEMTRWEAKT